MKNSLKKLCTFILIILCFILTGCKKSLETQNSNTKINIAVSIVPEETFVKEVGGALVDVITMIPPGESPTNFEPTPKLIEKFSKSNLYFSIGVPTEKSSLLPVAKDLSNTMKIVDLASEVEKTYPSREFSPGKKDPHIWLSPKRVKIMVNMIKIELSKIDPENKSTYENNAEGYIKKLNKLDSNIKKSLENLETNTVIVYHPSLGYFCDDYGLKMLSLEEEGKESTVQSLQNNIDIAKGKSIKVIFYQSEIDSSQSTTFADEIGGKAQQVSPLAPNYIENLQTIANTFNSILNN
ncbi:zinc ABC transporter substrate-binding protein [Clostridium aestuarii]|uniref:Zinc ABC transporter substrate-binding protein n=1 Tax=Clostridium aestuarii TaxID=338193 RepID=A0ABT4D348_9CLOT|nr:zinc ABC transporter substrate-binding protein [Clostridium aestuarii]MCY6485661.1 zinc ABC transporter substrate-binding protein [Clostridium aestuarii]